jgi:hypothetical protein
MVSAHSSSRSVRASANEASHTRRAIDHAQAFLRLEHKRFVREPLQRAGGAHTAGVIADKSFADQHQRDMRHMTQIPDRAKRRHFGRQSAVEQRGEQLHELEAHAGMPVGEVVHGCRDDRARLFTP